MSNNIDLKRGLTIPLSGAAALKTSGTIVPQTVAIKPTDFKGFAPRLLVREGDKVLAGSPVLADKQNPDLLVSSPVSGEIQAIVRGDKRKLLAVLVKADEKVQYQDFGIHNPGGMKAEEVKELLLKAGLFPALVQRPYGIVADPSLTPKAIFISTFSTAPLAADTEYTLSEDFAAFQACVDALGKLTPGGVHVGISKATASSSPFHKVERAIIHEVSGKHPAGNVGVQISHISPIMKGDTVWTLSPVLAVAIGRLLLTGKVDLRRKIAVTGPMAIDPAYVDALPGIPVKSLRKFYDPTANELRFVSGDALSGESIGEDGYLGYFSDQITILREGRERELLGWINPIRPKQFSSSRAYFSWLTPKKTYPIDTNTHGGVRAFVCSNVYGDVLPMDIFPVYLIKACLAGNIDDMEKYGIYEVLPEDLATCEFVDPSKNDIQDIIAKGIDTMIKEMS